ncbi:hypothetical protein HYFRA_00012628 [Hymenoscyphus fraxineus]|uniref:Uncharacterized protein n=1 Tax=Hymenoscyphus fraxineus TaxID=746836 RepID=A0A9N9PXF5_9HELO|nr:hypothetical protein HYFRA_00012628 [Hymenoscyphus fraxineus]
MSPALTVEPLDFEAPINYFSPQKEKLRHEALKPKQFGKPDDDSRVAKVHDLRGKEDQFTLADNGFIFTELKTSGKDEDFFNEEWVKSVYYKEVGEVVKKVTGCDLAIVYQHVNRSAAQSLDESNPANMGDPAKNGPATKPHCDFSGEHMDAYPKLMGASLPKPIKDMWDSSSRWAMYGAWKPRVTITRDPLIVADSQSLRDEDYLPVEREVGPDGHKFILGNYLIAQPSEENAHKWYYLHRQRPDEIVIFGGTDTKQDKKGWRCAHTAAVNPHYVNDPPRESIEVRCVAIWK